MGEFKCKDKFSLLIRCKLDHSGSAPTTPMVVSELPPDLSPHAAVLAAIRLRARSTISADELGSDTRILVSQRFVSPCVESIFVCAPLSPSFPKAKPSGRYLSASAPRAYFESGFHWYSSPSATD